MAHRAFVRTVKGISYKLPELMSKPHPEKQHFRNLLVLDFEATCEQPGRALSCQEIIEFPCVALSTEDWKVKDVFHEYVKPRIHPEVTTFCTDLTGIMQENVANQPFFPEIFQQFNDWLKEGGYFDEEQKSAFVTSGDWDLNVMLPNQCKLDGITAPEYFDKWIDLKKIFFKINNRYPRGLKGMAKELNLPFTGKLHSGLNDVHNMVKFIVRLQEMHKVNYEINSSRKELNKLSQLLRRT